MFGGDEVGAIVVDMGTTWTKVGYAGEGAPKHVFPSLCATSLKSKGSSGVGQGAVAMEDVGDEETKEKSNSANGASSSSSAGSKYFVGNDALYRRDNTKLFSPLSYGIVRDWDGVDQIYDFMFKRELRCDPKDHPIMLADRAFNSNARRKKIVSLLFEKYQAPGVFLARSPVLATFAGGKTTSLVLDCGGDVTSSVPVHEGYVVHSGIRKTKVAGDMVDLRLRQLTFPAKSKTKLHPRYEVQRELTGPTMKRTAKVLSFPNTHESFRNYMQMDVIRDMKHSLARVNESIFDVNAAVPIETYELPDGKQLPVGAQRFIAGEMLFRPPADFKVKEDLDAHRGFSFKGMSNMVMQSVKAVDEDIQRELLSSVIVTGGTSCMTGFPERLHKDLNLNMPPAFKAKITLPNTKAERQYAVWIGGSILGSLGSFHQMWLSRQEFEEHGADILAKKCP